MHITSNHRFNGMQEIMPVAHASGSKRQLCLSGWVHAHERGLGGFELIQMYLALWLSFLLCMNKERHKGEQKYAMTPVVQACTEYFIWGLYFFYLLKLAAVCIIADYMTDSKVRVQRDSFIHYWKPCKLYKKSQEQSNENNLAHGLLGLLFIYYIF